MNESHLNRRAVVGIGLGLAAGALGSQASASRPPQPDTCPPDDGKADTYTHTEQSVRLDTPLGALIGSAITVDGDRVLSFKGIPYALPPVGDRRWTPAAPAPGWNCTRDARAFSPQAVQLTEPDTAFFSLPQSVQNEDCLYLNIWTPESATKGEPGRPVMVWIHGGAFIGGAGSLPVYDGAALARKDVLVVTINYRLGVFGYFTHPDLIAEADGGICANFGTTDQIAALQWVQKNIAAFGGDPNQVTIFGESAGSMSVCQLMASPLTKGLFHRAIGQSGGYFYPMREIGRAAWGGPPAEEIGKTFSERIGAPSLADLRKIPAQDLAVAAASEAQLLNQLGAMIVVDGKVFDKQIHETFKAGKQQAVPVLLGFNADEGSGIADYGGIPSISDPIKYEAEVRRIYGALAEEYLYLYPASDPQDSAFAAFRDDAFGWHMMEWADLMSRTSCKVFFYHFVHTPPGADQLRPVAQGTNSHRIGAYHASEIAYVFNNMNHRILSVWGDGETNENRPFGPVRPVDSRLADIMSDYWVTFAKSGVPRAEGRPEWREYKRSTGHYMRFGPEATPSENLLPRMWETQSKIMNARRKSDAFWYFANEGLAGPAITAGKAR